MTTEKTRTEADGRRAEATAGLKRLLEGHTVRETRTTVCEYADGRPSVRQTVTRVRELPPDLKAIVFVLTGRMPRRWGEGGPKPSGGGGSRRASERPDSRTDLPQERRSAPEQSGTGRPGPETDAGFPESDTPEAGWPDLSALSDEALRLLAGDSGFPGFSAAPGNCANACETCAPAADPVIPNNPAFQNTAPDTDAPKDATPGLPTDSAPGESRSATPPPSETGFSAPSNISFVPTAKGNESAVFDPALSPEKRPLPFPAPENRAASRSGSADCIICGHSRYTDRPFVFQPVSPRKAARESQTDWAALRSRGLRAAGLWMKVRKNAGPKACPSDCPAIKIFRPRANASSLSETLSSSVSAVPGSAPANTPLSSPAKGNPPATAFDRPAPSGSATDSAAASLLSEIHTPGSGAFGTTAPGTAPCDPQAASRNGHPTTGKPADFPADGSPEPRQTGDEDVYPSAACTPGDPVLEAAAPGFPPTDSTPCESRSAISPSSGTNRPAPSGSAPASAPSSEKPPLSFSAKETQAAPAPIPARPNPPPDTRPHGENPPPDRPVPPREQEPDTRVRPDGRNPFRSAGQLPHAFFFHTPISCRP